MNYLIVKLLLQLAWSNINFSGKWRIFSWLKRNKTIIQTMPPRKVWIDKKIFFFVNPTSNFDVYIHGFNGTPPVETIIRKYVKQGDTVLDVGANLGWTALLCSEIVGNTGSVHAFEPIPNVYKNLLENKAIAEFCNIKTYQLAISDSSGIADLFLDNADETALASMRPQNSKAASYIIQAKMVTLDSFIPALEAVSFVKIDVEGAEFKVLRGMIKIIERDHPILAIELTNNWLEKFGDSSEMLIKFLKNNNYEIYIASENDFIPLIETPSEQVDIVCIPRKTTCS